MRRIAALAAVTALAACSTGPRGTDRAPAYFEALRPVAVSVTGAVADVGEVFEAPYDSDALRRTRLVDLTAGLDLAVAADRASRLEPGSVYAADHERYLQTIADLRALYRSFDQAVALGSVARAASVAVAMETAAGIGFAGTSAEYCARVTFEMRLCDRPAGPSEYEAVLFTVMLELAAGYAPLLRPAPPALVREEASEYLGIVDAEAEQRLDRAAASLDAADPPAELRADHEAVVSVLRAAAAFQHDGGDHRFLPGLFCDAAAGLSARAAELTAVFFGDDDLGCEA